MQFSISTQFKCQTVLFDRTLSDAARVDMRVMARRVTESSSNCLMSYPGHSAEMKSVHCSAPADWAIRSQVIVDIFNKEIKTWK